MNDEKRPISIFVITVMVILPLIIPPVYMAYKEYGIFGFIITYFIFILISIFGGRKRTFIDGRTIGPVWRKSKR